MTALRKALEAALVANPDDLAAHMAYGDLLSEQGDPRGEFIQVQLALEDPSRPAEQRRELQQRKAELLKKNLPDWLGPIHAVFTDTGRRRRRGELGPFGLSYFNPEVFRYRFSRGWLESLVLGDLNSQVVEALHDCPAAGLLREFAVSDAEGREEGVAELAGLPFLGTMRKFRLGPDDDQCHITGTGIGPAIARMPHLEELYLYAHRVEVNEVFALPMPQLRTLDAFHLHEYPIEVLAANPTLGNLVKLHCWPRAMEYDDADEGAYITADGFIALVNSPHLKSLAELRLYLTDIGDRGIAAFASSEMLKRLRILDLTNGCITDEGAQALAAAPGLSRLPQLILSKNAMTEAGIAVLQATGVNLQAEDQHDFEDERVYLWEGDCE